MTEEKFSPVSDFPEKNIFPNRRVPSERKKILRQCLFCEFAQDIGELEELGPSDEELILYHLRHDHGLYR